MARADKDGDKAGGRRSPVAASSAPLQCVAPDTLAQALAPLPKDMQEPVRTLVADGNSLAAQRKQWQEEVRRSKSTSINLRLPPPNFGCDNPGLGSALSSPGRTREGTMFFDPDCDAAALKTVGKPSPYANPAQAGAQKAHFDQVARLKEQDVDLSGRELRHAAALAASLRQATTAWTQADPSTFGVPDLAGMDLFREKVVLACAAQGRVDAGVQQDFDGQRVALGRLYETVLQKRGPGVVPELKAATSTSAMNATVSRMFPTEFLLGKASAQPDIARTLSAERTRVASLDDAARQKREAESAIQRKQAFDASPVGILKKRYADNVAKNGPPMAEDMLSTTTRYVFDEHTANRDNSGFTFTDDGEIEYLFSAPLIGTVVSYRSRIVLDKWTCAPKGKEQVCQVAYREVVEAASKILAAPPADIVRQHTATFQWTENGLRSPQYKQAIAAAHATWRAKDNARLGEMNEADSKRSACRDRMGNAPEHRKGAICG